MHPVLISVVQLLLEWQVALPEVHVGEREAGRVSMRAEQGGGKLLEIVAMKVSCFG